MDTQKLNTKPDLHKLTNGNPLPGSYIIKDGKFFPNTDDEAMQNRSVIASPIDREKQSAEKEDKEIKKD